MARPNDRSVHTRPLPYLGGIAIYVAFVAAAAYGLGPTNRLVIVLAACGGAILTLGMIDDLRPLPPWIKLGVETMIAAVTVLWGVQIQWVTNPLGGMFSLGAWAIPVTVAWLVVVPNLVNFIDGLDGLAAGVSSIVALTLLFACHQAGQAHTALMTAALAGSALGFLPHNYNPAKIIMGDAGALFLGYAIAVISVEGPIKSATALALFVPVLALGVPIMDAGFAVWRRFTSGKPVMAADRDHLHHRLLGLGLSQRQAVLVMYSVTGFFGVSAVTLTELSPERAAVLVAALFSFLYFGARRSGLLRSLSGPNNLPFAGSRSAWETAAGLDDPARPCTRSGAGKSQNRGRGV
jgi:UDP-GlcNAc:undecaprenyl-phosphate GlcNAc-1-phosphate transferase